MSELLALSGITYLFYMIDFFQVLFQSAAYKRNF